MFHRVSRCSVRFRAGTPSGPPRAPEPPDNPLGLAGVTCENSGPSCANRRRRGATFPSSWRASQRQQPGGAGGWDEVGAHTRCPSGWAIRICQSCALLSICLGTASPRPRQNTASDWRRMSKCLDTERACGPSNARTERHQRVFTYHWGTAGLPSEGIEGKWGARR